LAIWLAVGLVMAALVPLTDDWMVYNNTGNVDGGSALWVDVPLTLLGLWLFVVPLGILAWRIRSTAARVTYLIVAILVGFAWWAYLSTEAAQSAGPLRPAPSAPATTPELNVEREVLIGIWGNDPNRPGSGIGLEFEKNGDFYGYDGCNYQSGNWKLNSATGQVGVASGTTTLVACPDRIDSVVDLETLRFDGSRVQYETLTGEKRFLFSME
jgi:heat shock protein HslJ